MTPNRMELEVNAKNELNYMVDDAETKTQCFCLAIHKLREENN